MVSGAKTVSSLNDVVDVYIEVGIILEIYNDPKIMSCVFSIMYALVSSSFSSFL